MPRFDADPIDAPRPSLDEGLQQLAPDFARTLLQLTPHAVIVVDDQQRIRFLNQAAERMFEVAADDTLGAPLDALIPESAADRHREHVAAFSRGDETARWMDERRPVQGRRRTGELFPARAAIASFNSAHRRFAAAVVEDLTSVRAREQELHDLVEILENTPDFVGLADPAGRITYHNAAARNVLGASALTPGAHVSRSHPEWAARKVLEEGFPAAARDGTWRGRTAVLDADQNEVPIDQVLIAHREPSGEVARISTIGRDLRPELALHAEIQRQARALEQAGDMVWITDPDGVIQYVNPAFERVTGYARSEAVGRNTSSLLASGEHSKAFYRRLWRTLSGQRTFRAVFSNRTRDGRSIHVDETIAAVVGDDGAIEAFVATGRDVTERMRLEQRLRELAYHDPLTRLPNRTQLWERLSEGIRHAERTGRGLAVLFLDLDRFKDINDALGHAAGDEVLRKVSARIVQRLRRRDSIGRHGGDELLAVLEDVDAPDTVERVALKMLEAVREPLEFQGSPLEISASIGVANYPVSGTTPDALVSAADAAMYEAKEAGGDRFAVHTAALNQCLRERSFLLRALRDAEQRGELAIHLQPIVRWPDAALTGAEVFLRWNSSERGSIDPARFIPIAEETGQIHGLGRWVLSRTCEAIAAWQNAGLAVPPLSVNASSVQLSTPGFADAVVGVLGDTGVGPDDLVIEMTESTFMGEGRHTPPTLEHLRQQGVGIAIDDFGTGYSSLGYLKRFPADRIKLDQTFVRALPGDPASMAIVESVVALGRAFGSSVVAEGVEREAEASTLHRLGVTEMQGFLFGAAMPLDVFEREWLRPCADSGAA